MSTQVVVSTTGLSQELELAELHDGLTLYSIAPSTARWMSTV
jgi:hypothetical protein